MTNITLSIDDEVYKKMRKFSEVKWSEFVRRCVQKRVEELTVKLAKSQTRKWYEFKLIKE